jgi:hypothetical protein
MVLDGLFEKDKGEDARGSQMVEINEHKGNCYAMVTDRDHG